jgi:hypothetical protein
MRPRDGKALKVFVESCIALNKTGVSLEFWSRMVLNTDSPGEQGLKPSLDWLILIIGMKGWEPGAKECPQRRTFMAMGGSISIWSKSSNIFYLMDPRSVLAVREDLVVWLEAARGFLVFRHEPLTRVMKAYAIWKK